MGEGSGAFRDTAMVSRIEAFPIELPAAMVVGLIGQVLYGRRRELSWRAGLSMHTG